MDKKNMHMTIIGKCTNCEQNIFQINTKIVVTHCTGYTIIYTKHSNNSDQK